MTSRTTTRNMKALPPPSRNNEKPDENFTNDDTDMDDLMERAFRLSIDVPVEDIHYKRSRQSSTQDKIDSYIRKKARQLESAGYSYEDIIDKISGMSIETTDNNLSDGLPDYEHKYTHDTRDSPMNHRKTQSASVTPTTQYNYIYHDNRVRSQSTPCSPSSSRSRHSSFSYAQPPIYHAAMPQVAPPSYTATETAAQAAPTVPVLANVVHTEAIPAITTGITLNPYDIAEQRRILNNKKGVTVEFLRERAMKASFAIQTADSTIADTIRKRDKQYASKYVSEQMIASMEALNNVSVDENITVPMVPRG
jgi:hypothetical protein